MIPDLFSGAAASAAAWVPASADVADATASSKGAADCFADLLAATIVPEAAASGDGSEPSSIVPGLPDIWLGMFTDMSQNPVTLDATDDEAALPLAGEDALDVAPEDMSTIAWAIPVPVPVPVPILVPLPPPSVTAYSAGTTPQGATGTAATAAPDAASSTSGLPAQDGNVAAEVAAAAGHGFTVRKTGPEGFTISEGRPLSKDELASVTSAKLNKAETAAPAAAVQVPVAAQPAPAAEAITPEAIPSTTARVPTNAGVSMEALKPAETTSDTFVQTAAPARVSTGAPVNDAALLSGQEADASSVTSPASRAAAAIAAREATIEQPQQAAPTPSAATPVAQAVSAQAAATAPKSNDGGTKASDVAANDPRMVGGAATSAPAVNVSTEQDQTSRDSASRHAFNAFVAAELKVRSSMGGHASESASVAAPFTTPVVGPTAQPVVQAPPPLVATPMAAPVLSEEAENVTKLVESMRFQVRQGVQEATVRLRPEHLGEVTISVRLDRGAVSAVVNAETPAVQRWLEAQEEKLRSGLADQGLNLERYVVQRDRQQQERREQRQYQPPPRYRQPQEQGQRFEVTV